MRASSRRVSMAVSRARVSRWTWASRRPPWSAARRESDGEVVWVGAVQGMPGVVKTA
jgi:hypothetical protein